MDDIALQRVAVPLGNRSFELLVPEPGGVEARFRRRQEAGEQPELPYWSRIWHSATALAAFLLQRPELIAGKRVLELAAGLGLPGLVAAEAAAAVVVSDYLPEAVDLLERNIAFSGMKNVSARRLDWNALPEDLRADVLLLSDVNYEPAAFAQLLVVIKKFLGQNTAVILATPQRLMAGPFIGQLAPLVRERNDMPVADSIISILLLGK
ncbi:class I SAM-dependent methyltransferase [Flaviaesturariibacter flavus]|nr:methyltransferase domain-containing protein [Flaviaesturariibacter flavus]